MFIKGGDFLGEVRGQRGSSKGFINPKMKKTLNIPLILFHMKHANLNCWTEGNPSGEILCFLAFSRIIPRNLNQKIFSTDSGNLLGSCYSVIHYGQ